MLLEVCPDPWPWWTPRGCSFQCPRGLRLWTGLVGRYRNHPNPLSDWTFKSHSGLENYEVADGTVLLVFLLIVVVPGVELDSFQSPRVLLTSLLEFQTLPSRWPGGPW